MTPEQYFPGELARLETKWRATNDLRLIAEAFDLCALNSVPLPDWTHAAIRQSIATAFYANGPEGRPGRGGYRDIAKRLDKHEQRHAIATWALGMRDSGELAGWKDDSGKPFALTRDGAFEFASWFLRGTPQQGDRAAIEKSFDKIQARNRRNDTPDH